jgi:hypothetical protein
VKVFFKWLVILMMTALVLGLVGALVYLLGSTYF